MEEEPSASAGWGDPRSAERLRAAERDLRAADERFRLLVEGARDFISYRFRLVPDQGFEHVSDGTLSILGIPPQRFLDDPDIWDELIHPDDREKAGQALDPATPVVMRWRRGDGEYVYLEHRRMGVYDEAGDLVAVEGLAHDVTEAVLAREELDAQERRFTSLVQNVSDLIIVVDGKGKLQYASPSLERLLGWAGEEEQTAGIRGQRIHPDDLPRLRSAFVHAPPPGPNPPVTTARSLHKDGTWRWLEYCITDLRDDPSVRGYVVVARDITERKDAEQQLVHQALHDALTGLPNRALFLDRLGLALSRLERRSGLAAVFFLDLDYFKVVNDSLGHSAGDQVLVAVADRLEESLRDGDTAARLGGDEFAVLCDDLVDEGEAVQIAERLGAAIAARPVKVAGRELVVSVSIGVAFATQSGQRPESLLRDADAAMYRAKERGRARYELFDAAMRARAVARLETEAALREAIDHGQLSLSYQPEVLLRDGSLVGAEALLRWRPGARGGNADGAPPADVIAVAEETGLIVPIGTWVVQQACRDLARWREVAPDRAPERVSVNLSGRQLARPELPDVVEEAVDAASLSPNSLCLEITESVLMDDIDVAVSALKALKAIGVEIAVDDFGTGYSSLAHLRRFPVDILKIDHSFVAGLGNNPEDAAIVRAVLALARTLELGVVAEGVERAEQLHELRALGCERAQGNLFAAPLPEPDFADLLVNA